MVEAYDQMARGNKTVAETMFQKGESYAKKSGIMTLPWDYRLKKAMIKEEVKNYKESFHIFCDLWNQISKSKNLNRDIKFYIMYFLYDRLRIYEKDLGFDVSGLNGFHEVKRSDFVMEKVPDRLKRNFPV
ncbi:MAG: hypothetical protein GY789_28125 [Hyphomicrobiales bacterium]|nr:hypothetical protein [Hyphomicrobiales bacterium]